MREEKKGGVDVETLQQIADQIKGEVAGDGILFKRGYVAQSRLGTSERPDPLGTVTSRDRPESLRTALRTLDERQVEVKSQ